MKQAVGRARSPAKRRSSQRGDYPELDGPFEMCLPRLVPSFRTERVAPRGVHCFFTAVGKHTLRGGAYNEAYKVMAW